jgi:sucrose phosphorylase
MPPKVELITYVDRLAGNFAGLKTLLEGPLAGLFGGVHVLPFFRPIDGADAGFDPADHLAVDSRLGDWSSVADLASRARVMADVIVNHISVDSREFADVYAHAEAAASWSLFLKKSDVFASAADDAELRSIYRPRPGPPFIELILADGRTHEFWTTFSSSQLDINVEAPAGRAYLEAILDRFAAAGIRSVRLDAAGYAIKRRGTRCFMLPETFTFIRSIAASAKSRGIDSLVEVHAHHRTQIDIASHVGCVYDFALPPLLLHALYTADPAPLKEWLAIAPRNCVTVLDTHDGIGIMDVARDGDQPGLLADDEIDRLVERIHLETAGDSRAASGHAASNLDVYQINTTFYAALGHADAAYLVARAVQLFLPGTPQIYYVGLLAGRNDVDLVRRTRVGRDINRHYYTPAELESAVALPVVKTLFELIRVRNATRAIGGRFTMLPSRSSQLAFRWQDGSAVCEFLADFLGRRAKIVITQDDVTRTHVVDASLRLES